MSNTNKILGAVLMVSSALILTIDKILIRISKSIVEAGYASHGTVRDRIPINDDSPGLLVYFLFIVGFVLLVAGFPRSSKKGVTNINTDKELHINKSDKEEIIIKE